MAQGKKRTKKLTEREIMKDRLKQQQEKLEAYEQVIGAIENNKNPGGAPTKYDPQFCEMLIEHMSKGLSFESFAGVVNVARRTLYDWVDANPEFLHAKTRGEGKSQIFWETLGVSGAAGKLPGFQNAAWIFNMKNRFGWTDRQDVTSGGEKMPTAQVQILLPSNGREIKKA